MTVVSSFIRSVLHLLFMAVTVVPWAMVVLVYSLFASSTAVYWLCAGWLRLAVQGGVALLGIQNRITGMENLPTPPAPSMV
jgi:1-acyl-sn-glycerol-3-phosphate acyltransferase